MSKETNFDVLYALCQASREKLQDEGLREDASSIALVLLHGLADVLGYEAVNDAICRFGAGDE